MLSLLLACTNPGPREVEPEPPVDLQLRRGFEQTLTQGFGCDGTTLAGPDTSSVLLDEEGTLEVHVTDVTLMVRIGTALDEGFDDDGCDDVVVRSGDPVPLITYVADDATEIRLLQDDGVRVYEVYDTVLEPTSSDAYDTADYQPLELDRLILGVVVLGETLRDLR